MRRVLNNNEEKKFRKQGTKGLSPYKRKQSLSIKVAKALYKVKNKNNILPKKSSPCFKKEKYSHGELITPSQRKQHLNKKH